MSVQLGKDAASKSLELSGYSCGVRKLRPQISYAWSKEQTISTILAKLQTPYSRCSFPVPAHFSFKNEESKWNILVLLTCEVKHDISKTKTAVDVNLAMIHRQTVLLKHPFKVVHLTVVLMCFQ